MPEVVQEMATLLRAAAESREGPVRVGTRERSAEVQLRNSLRAQKRDHELDRFVANTA